MKAGKVLGKVSVPGRMNAFYLKNGALVLVDYAHNYLSLKAVSHVAKQIKPNGKLIILTGSAGGKALSRRPDMGKAISEEADIAILTMDDPNFEQVAAINDEIAKAITNDKVQVISEENRQEAVLKALEMADSQSAVILAGKGSEKTMKINGQAIPYESDIQIVKDYLK
jgi:UDP-N-acetylmuramoyl-L-alanyl-D-glutamate-L-lysine ligase